MWPFYASDEAPGDKQWGNGERLTQAEASAAASADMIGRNIRR